MKKLTVLPAVLMAALLFCGAYVNAEPSVSPIEKLITEMADNPADHKALAEYYRGKAADAKAEVALHQSMKKSYVNTHAQSKGVPLSNHTGKHCDRLIKSYETAAAEYEALANLHESEAKK